MACSPLQVVSGSVWCVGVVYTSVLVANIALNVIASVHCHAMSIMHVELASYDCYMYSS